MPYFGPESARSRSDSYGPPAGLEAAALAEPADRVVAELRRRGVNPTQTETVVAELRLLQSAGFDLGEVAEVANGWANSRSSGVAPARAARIGGSLTKLKSCGIGPYIVHEVAETLARHRAPAREMAAAQPPKSAGDYPAFASAWRALREQTNPTPAVALAKLGAGGKILGAEAARLQAEGWEVAARHANRLGR